MLDQELLKRCLNCHFLKSRHGTLVCKPGKSPEKCRGTRARERRNRKSIETKQIPKTSGRHVIITKEKLKGG